jgi:predicted SAM-dependent methyltransferase
LSEQTGRNADGKVLRDYLQFVEEKQKDLREGHSSDSRLRRMTKFAVPVRYRGTARMLITDAMAPAQRRKAKTLAAGRSPLRLHLGSGPEHKDGWVNIDLIGDPVDVAWDLARGIPFESETAESIFHEHLLEHIPLGSAITLMEDCFRVLRTGGVLRVGVPDAGALINSYATDRSYLEAIHPERPTAMLAVQELFYWHRHTTMFDEETLALLFRAAGFVECRKQSPGETRLPEAPDTPRRWAETLYMEGVKP